MKKDSSVKTKVIIPCRLSYANVWEPQSVNGSEPKYSVSAIISKSDNVTVSKIKSAIEEAKKKAISKWGGKIPENMVMPIKDGDIERPEDEIYEGSYFINANSYICPEIVDMNLHPITDKSQVYSGCYGRISVTFYGYNTNGNSGIAAGLGNIQKLKDGEPLSTRTTAQDDFDVVSDYDFLQ